MLRQVVISRVKRKENAPVLYYMQIYSRGITDLNIKKKYLKPSKDKIYLFVAGKKTIKLMKFLIVLKINTSQM